MRIGGCAMSAELTSRIAAPRRLATQLRGPHPSFLRAAVGRGDPFGVAGSNGAALRFRRAVVTSSMRIGGCAMSAELTSRIAAPRRLATQLRGPHPVF
jgi:hypothetical protein